MTIYGGRKKGERGREGRRDEIREGEEEGGQKGDRKRKREGEGKGEGRKEGGQCVAECQRRGGCDSVISYYSGPHTTDQQETGVQTPPGATDTHTMRHVPTWTYGATR